MNPEDEREPRQLSNRRWLILAFLMALCFTGHFNRASIASAGDERIMRQYGLSPEKMGVVYSSFLIVYTLFMVPGGLFIDRWGPRIALLCLGLGSAAFCAFTGGIGFGLVAGGEVWLALLLVRSLMGLLNTPLHPASARAVANWFPAGEQFLANGLITGASVVAYAVVHAVFGELIDRFDWPIAFVICGAATALLALAWGIFSRDAPANPGANGKEQAREIAETAALSSGSWLEISTRSLCFLTLGYSAVGYFQYLFFYWLHYYFDSILKMSKDESRFLAGLPNLALAAGMVIGGVLTGQFSRWFGRKLGRTLLPQIGMTLSALFLICGVLVHDRYWIVFWFTASLGCLGLCESSFWTMAVRLGGTRGGTVAAIMNTGGNGIGLLAPMITPWVGTHLGWQWGIGLGAIVGLLGALCWFGIDPEPRAAEIKTGT